MAVLTRNVSGTEQVALDLVRSLRQDGIGVSALVPEGNARLDAYAQSMQALTSEVLRIPPIQGPAQRAAGFARATAAFRRLRPACVHFHCPSYRWSPEFVLAARLARVPAIVRTEHNPLLTPVPFPLSTLMQLGDDAVAKFTYVSKGNRDRFEHFLPRRKERGETVNNGIDLARFTAPVDLEAGRRRVREEFGFADDTQIAVFVGAFGGRRPLAPIFTSFTSLLADPERRSLAEKWRILVIGTGDFQAEISGFGEAARFVHYAGQRADVAQLVPFCNLFVTASQFEGLSMAMLESWAVGVPVLAYAVDGIEDVVGEELARRETAAPGDSKRYAQLWFDFMTSDSTRLQAHARATTAVRERFGRERMLSEYKSIYRALGALR